ncbi:MAG: alginate export family protein [Candidatus Omnitrophota bacterium]
MKWVKFVVLIAFIAVFCFAPAGYADEISELKKQMNLMRKQMEAMQGRIEALENEKEELKASAVDQRLASLEGKVDRKAAEWTDMVKIRGGLQGYYLCQNDNYFMKNSAYFLETTARLGADIKVNDNISAEIMFTGENEAGDAFDYSGLATDNWNFEVELANITYSDIMDVPLSITAGRQNLQYGDGFLIYDGYSDARAVWTASIRSFYAVKGVYEWGPWQIDGFAAMPDRNYQSYETYLTDMTVQTGLRYLYGGNVHLDDETYGIWDFGIFYKDDKSMFESNTLAISQRGEYTFNLWPDSEVLPKITLTGEIVEEVGRTKVQNMTFALGNPRENRASIGGHGDVTLSFENMTFAPYVTGRYIYLPGDDPNTEENEAFDPMFYGSSDWGKWYLGDINSNNLYNSNMRVIMLEAGLYPTETTSVRAQYFYTTLDREITANARKQWSNEINIMFDWYPNDWFWCGLLWGHAHPLKAAKEYTGDKQNTTEVVLYAGVDF